LKSWVSKVKELKSVVHVQDVNSVSHYVRVFNKKYSERAKVSDIREGDNGALISLPLKEFKNAPNNMQMAISQISTELFNRYP